MSKKRKAPGPNRVHTEVIHVKMDAPLNKRLHRLCKTNDRSMSAEIRRLIARACDDAGVAA